MALFPSLAINTSLMFGRAGFFIAQIENDPAFDDFTKPLSRAH